jgi:hypothetical protein
MERPRPLLAHRSSWTWSAWLRPEAGGVLSSEGEPRVTLSIVMREDGAIALGAWHVETAEWISSVSSPALVPLGEWSHVAIALDAGGARAGTVSFYVDGRLTDKVDGQAAVSPWTVFATLGDSVGAYYGGGQERAPYLGEMDEIRVHDHALDLGVLREYTNSAARN